MKVLRDAVRRLERTDELRSGVASSVCDKRDNRCENGEGNARRDPVKAGTPIQELFVSRKSGSCMLSPSIQN